MKKRYVWIVGLIAVYLLLVWLLYAIEGRQPALMPEESPSVNILSFTDALWYSLTTISTVGYGDKVPASAWGKLIGFIFVLCSAGMLTALIGLGLRLINGTLIPRLQLWLGKRRTWYVFSEYNADSCALAEALCRDRPDSMLVFPGGEESPFASENVVRISEGIPALIRLRKNMQGLYFFAMSSDPWQNYALSTSAAERGVMSYCMGNIQPETATEHLQLFSVTEAMSRRYWDTYPLLDTEQCVVLIGCDEAGRALLERALLNNVFISERRIEYHVFGDTDAFSDLHPEIVKALDGNIVGGDRLTLHKERWTSARELLERADRIVLCADDDAENLAAYDLLRGWYVIRAVPHLRLDTPLPGFICFGEKTASLTPENVMKEELNRRATLMNDIYNEGSPSPTAWQALSPFLRQSNIAAADHLLVKARYLLNNETLTMLTSEDCARAYARYQELFPEQADLLQEMEHRRWMRFYQMYNWQYAPKRDNALRSHPLLLPYSQLSKADQVKDAYAWEMFDRLSKIKG